MKKIKDNNHQGLAWKAHGMRFTLPNFLDWRRHTFEFVGSRAKLDGVCLKKIEMLQLISTVNNDLAIDLLNDKYLCYNDVAMHLLRNILQCGNVDVISNSTRIRVALLNE